MTVSVSTKTKTQTSIGYWDPHGPLEYELERLRKYFYAVLTCSTIIGAHDVASLALREYELGGRHETNH